MDEIVVDARGLACPIPVVKAKNAIEGAGPGCRVVVLVNGETARENVARMARQMGCEVAISGEGPEFEVTALTAARPATGGESKKAPALALYVNSDRMGKGDDTLGSILMRAFFQTLKETKPAPGKIVFVNSGVFLTTSGSEVLGNLRDLEKAGVGIVSCGTCLDFYKLTEKLEVGIVSNMYEIASILAGADRIVSP